MELTLVRHGQSTANRDGILQGQFDAPLTELGRRQARQLGTWFARHEMSWDAVYCSPLSRARDTARIITDGLGRAPALEVPDLMELHAGEMQGKPAPVREQHPSYFARGLAGIGDYTEFGGESYEAIQARVGRLLALLSERHRAAADRVLIVSHGGLMFQLTKALICQPVPHVLMIKFGNCSATRIHLRLRRGEYIGEIEWHLPVEFLGGEPSAGTGVL